MVPIIRRHFSEDAYGNKDMPNLESIIAQLDSYHDDYYLHQHANKILRNKYLAHPPKGYTKHQISTMNEDALICLDMNLKGQ